MTVACCERLRQLPGGAMCPLHGQQRRPRQQRRPSQTVGRHRQGMLVTSEQVDVMLAGLVRALETIRRQVRP